MEGRVEVERVRVVGSRVSRQECPDALGRCAELECMLGATWRGQLAARRLGLRKDGIAQGAVFA